MALTNAEGLKTKLTNIADAIRDTSGRAGTLKLDDMPTEIRSLSGKLLLNPADTKDYVRVESSRVASKVREFLQDDSIVFIGVSDTHYWGTWPIDQRPGNMSALTAIKSLTYTLPIDFIAHLGDVGNEGDKLNVNNLVATQREFTQYLKEICGDKIPLFVAIGNHDTGTYVTPVVKDEQGNIVSGDYYDHVPAETLYNTLTATMNMDGNAVMCDDRSGGGYGYRDILYYEDSLEASNNKYLRVFLLNSCENLTKSDLTEGVTDTQICWVGDKLLEIKDNSNYSVIALCHYPLDFWHMRTFSDLFAAFTNREKVEVAGKSFNFENCTAEFFAQFHGHIHNYSHNKLFNTNLEQYNAYRIAIPSVEFGRENTYYNKSGSSLDGKLNDITYFEGTWSVADQKPTDTPEYLVKKSNEARDTAFTVNVINPSQQQIYSFSYGAGPIKRSVSRNNDEYSITTYISEGVNLYASHSSFIKKDEALTASFDIDDGYDYAGCIIYMYDETGRQYVDVSEYCQNMLINIPKVTGDIKIYIYTEKINYSNLRYIAYDEDYPTRLAIFNEGKGFINGYRLTTDSTNSAVWNKACPGYVTTGFIPWDRETAITIIGADFIKSDSNCRIYAYDDYRNGKGWYVGGDSSSSTYIENYFTVEETTSGVTLTPIDGKIRTDVKYIAISLAGSGEDLMVHCGIDTSRIPYSVEHNLENVELSNELPFVFEGDTYTTKVTPVHPQYTITECTVTMGGVLQAACYDANTGIITVDNVTNCLVITVKTAIVDVYHITMDLPAFVQTDIDLRNSYLKTGTQQIPLIVADGYRVDAVQVYVNGDLSTVHGGLTGENILELSSAIQKDANVHIVISGSSKSDYSNLIPISVELPGSYKFFNATNGYKSGYQYSTSSASIVTESSSMYCTGYMPLGQVSVGDQIRLKNIDLDVGSSHVYFVLLTENKKQADVLESTQNADRYTFYLNSTSANGCMKVTERTSNSATIELLKDSYDNMPIKYCVVCGPSITGSSVVTLNEEIIPNYVVNQTLINMTSDIPDTGVTVTEGDSFTANLAIEDSFKNATIGVLMNNEDVSVEAITDYGNGQYGIYISNVTGNVDILARAHDFNNLVTGYTNGVRINSSYLETDAPGMTTTDFIEVTPGAKTIRIVSDGSIPIDCNNTRISTYDANLNGLYNIPYRLMGAPGVSDGKYWNGEIVEEEATTLTLYVDERTNLANGGYMRICIYGHGCNLIVTVDEEVTYDHIIEEPDEPEIPAAPEDPVEPEVTTQSTGNLIPYATESLDSTTMFNPPKGWAADKRCSTTDLTIKDATTSTGHMCTTGYMPLPHTGCAAGDVFKITKATVEAQPWDGTPYGTSCFALVHTSTSTTSGIRSDVCITHDSSNTLLSAGGTTDSVEIVVDVDGSIIVTLLKDLPRVTHCILSCGIISDDTSVEYFYQA